MPPQHWRVICLAVAMMLAVSPMLAGGCNGADKNASTIAVTPCDDSLPEDALLTCRLLKGSREGKLPRQINQVDAEKLVAEMEKLTLITRQAHRGQATQAQLNDQWASSNDICQELAGLSCADLFFTPH